jgi:hypothetical protein
MWMYSDWLVLPQTLAALPSKRVRLSILVSDWLSKCRDVKIMSSFWVMSFRSGTSMVCIKQPLVHVLISMVSIVNETIYGG